MRRACPLVSVTGLTDLQERGNGKHATRETEGSGKRWGKKSLILPTPSVHCRRRSHHENCACPYRDQVTATSVRQLMSPGAPICAKTRLPQGGSLLRFCRDLSATSRRGCRDAKRKWVNRRLTYRGSHPATPFPCSVRHRGQPTRPASRDRNGFQLNSPCIRFPPIAVSLQAHFGGWVVWGKKETRRRRGRKRRVGARYRVCINDRRRHINSSPVARKATARLESSP